MQATDAPTADTEEATDAQGDEQQEAQGQEGSEEVADSGPSERESALMHLLSHYAPDLDVEEELAFVIPTEDGGYRYRPSAPAASQEEDAPKPKPKLKPRQSTRRRPAAGAATSVGKGATLEQKAAAYQTAVAAGGKALN